MNRQNAFDAWNARKSQAHVSGEFTDRVMAGIRRCEATRAEHLTLRLRSAAARPWVRTAAVITGTLLGLVRIFVTLHLILFA